MRISNRVEGIVVSLILVWLMATTLGGAAAAPPPPPLNPPPDPYPDDFCPYPPTNAELYYVRNPPYLSGSFTMDIGPGVVSFSMVPKDTERYSIGYYSSFSPGMTITEGGPLWTAMQQTGPFGNYIWPRWFNDASYGYTDGEENQYWPGWRFYFEDREWESGDRDIDDLWIDVGWRRVGSEIWIIIKPSFNEAKLENPLEVTFERVSGGEPIRFTYVINEESSGGTRRSGTFLLEDEPVSMQVFDSGDTGDWSLFYGSIPALPVAAVPAALMATALILRKRKR